MIRSLNRREALCLGAAAVLGAPLAKAQSQSDRRHPIGLFTKPFNALTFDELADRVAELGFDGIEAPIRRGGHIEPQNVETELPNLVEALRARDLQILVMASDINDPEDPLTERVLQTAAGLGIKRYRMKYLSYDLKEPIAKQLRQWRPRLRDLAAMNDQLGIQAVYQNHAGNRLLGAAIWDLAEILKGIPVQHIGVAYDVRHAQVEGGMSWPISFHRIRPHIDTVYVKDFRWVEGRVRNVPLGSGWVDPRVFDMLAETGFTGPVSLHEEYLDHRDADLIPKHWEAIEQDVATLRRWLSG